MTSPNRSGVATIVVASSAAVVALCAVVATVALVDSRTEQPGAPVPRPLVSVTPSTTMRSTSPAPLYFDMNKVEPEIQSVLIDSYKLQAGPVTCPPRVPVVAGGDFTCEVTVSGARNVVEITVKSADGYFQVGQPQPVG